MKKIIIFILIFLAGFAVGNAVKSYLSDYAKNFQPAQKAVDNSLAQNGNADNNEDAINKQQQSFQEKDILPQDIKSDFAQNAKKSSQAAKPKENEKALFEKELNGIFYEKQESFYVSRVIDGDTITLNNGKDVRFVGIDAPEYGEKCYLESKIKLENLILGQKVHLEKDKSENDIYSRLLRYVYTDDGVMINAIMLKSGYAKAMTIAPDIKYNSLFKTYQEDAEFFERGCLFQSSQKDGVGGAPDIEKELGWSTAGGEMIDSNALIGSWHNSEENDNTASASATDNIATTTIEVVLKDASAATGTPETATSTLEVILEDLSIATSTLAAPTSTPVKSIVINEIQIGGETSKDEFVELYNASSNTVDISDWKLIKKTKSGKEYNLVSKFPQETYISANSYFLITHKTDYKGEVEADITFSGASYCISKNNTVLLKNASSTIDKVGFGQAQDFETSPAENPMDYQSISRIDFIDTDNNKNDFIVVSSTPQNSFSGK